jgi:predicted TIM-barrel fold metal-dependent hydrolase
VSVSWPATHLRGGRESAFFSHAGGTIPFLVNRINGQAVILGKQGWVDQVQKLYYDTAGSANAAAFGPLLKLVTSKQVVFGSDFPFNAAAGVKSAVANLRTLGLSDAELQDIEVGNARGLFQRFEVA